MSEPTKEIELYYDTGDLFLESFQDRDGRGELFVPSPPEGDPPDLGKVGALVAANVHFADRGISFRLVVRVAWNRPRGNQRLPAGIGLTIVEDEVGRRDKLLALARGDSAEWFDRRAPRFKVKVPVRIVVPEGELEGKDPIDLSETGMKVSLRHPPEVGARVQVILPSASAVPCLSLRLMGRVVWCSREGDPPTMGIEFDEQPRTRRALANLIVKLRRKQGDAGVGQERAAPGS